MAESNGNVDNKKMLFDSVLTLALAQPVAPETKFLCHLQLVKEVIWTSGPTVHRHVRREVSHDAHIRKLVCVFPEVSHVGDAGLNSAVAKVRHPMPNSPQLRILENRLQRDGLHLAGVPKGTAFSLANPPFPVNSGNAPLAKRADDSPPRTTCSGHQRVEIRKLRCEIRREAVLGSYNRRAMTPHSEKLRRIRQLGWRARSVNLPELRASRFQAHPTLSIYMWAESTTGWAGRFCSGCRIVALVER